MAIARLNTDRIADWQSFHEVCREAFGFPGFYGMNMDAWIDCLTDLDLDDGMSRFQLAAGELLQIEVLASERFQARLPDIFAALVECSAFVNQRYLTAGKSATLELLFL